MFEEHMRKIVSNWKSARRRNNNAKVNVKTKVQKRKQRLTNGTGNFCSLKSLDHELYSVACSNIFFKTTYFRLSTIVSL